MENTAVAVGDIYNDLAPELERQGIKALLPTHVTIESFARTAAVAIAKDNDLANADRTSVIMALTRCATDGLIPDGREAALVTYNTKVKGTNGRSDTWIKKAQYMPMVDGVLKRARQSNQIDVIAGKAVFEGDTFDYWMDENGEHINYKPKLVGRGTFVLSFAFAKMKTGELIVEVMTKEDVERVRAASKGSDSGPWKDWYDRMAVKSALHRLARRLPNASELMAMLEQGMMMDWQEKEVNARPVIENTAESKSQAVLNKLRSRKQESPDVVDTQTDSTVEPPPYTDEQRAQLDDLVAKMGYCESIKELKEVANGIAAIGTIPDDERQRATEAYHVNQNRIKDAFQQTAPV